MKNTAQQIVDAIYDELLENYDWDKENFCVDEDEDEQKSKWRCYFKATNNYVEPNDWRHLDVRYEVKEVNIETDLDLDINELEYEVMFLLGEKLLRFISY